MGLKVEISAYYIAQKNLAKRRTDRFGQRSLMKVQKVDCVTSHITTHAGGSWSVVFPESPTGHPETRSGVFGPVRVKIFNPCRVLLSRFFARFWLVKVVFLKGKTS